MIGLHIILTVNYKKGKELQLSFWATCVNEDGSSSDTCQETCLTEGCWENSWGLAELNCVIGRKNILLVSTYIWNIIVDVHLPLLAKCVCTVTGYKACKKQYQMSPIKVFQRCVLFPWGGEGRRWLIMLQFPILHLLLVISSLRAKITSLGEQIWRLPFSHFCLHSCC